MAARATHEPEGEPGAGLGPALAFLRRHRTLILLHSNADLDCVGSALALKEAFPTSTLAAPLGVSGAGKRLVAGLDLEPIIEELPDPDGYQGLVVVDTGNPSQVTLPAADLPLLVIDHHQTLAGWPAEALILCEPDRTSCAELVYVLLEQGGLTINPTASLALMAGMVADTAHFRHARPETFTLFARLLSLHHESPSQVYELLRADNHRDLSRRVAQLKGGQRLRYVRQGDTLIALSRTGAFESSTANALLSLGADVAFVASQKKRQVQLSARCRQRLLPAGFNLGALLQELASQTGMEAGGHPGAAALKGQGDAEALLNLACRAAQQALAD